MRALVVFALAAAAADVTVGTDDEPTPVKTAAKLRAALAKGDPVIELWDDVLLDGAPAVATHDVVICELAACKTLARPVCARPGFLLGRDPPSAT